MPKRGNDRPHKPRQEPPQDTKPEAIWPVFNEDVMRDIDQILEDEAPGRSSSQPPSTPARAPDRPSEATATPSGAPMKQTPAGGMGVPAPAGQPVPPAEAATPVPRATPESHNRAANLATQALKLMKTREQDRAVQFARRALELDRNCVDALVVLAHARATEPNELVEKLNTAVERGERGLGRSYFETNLGKFWALAETRPYMRARQELANLFRDLGRYDEAIGHYEAMLELNPGDPLRVRDALVGCHLALGYLEPASDLLADFQRDTSATLAWARVLERYLTRHETEATVALTKARESNSLVEDYVLGRKPMPRHTPSEYTRGQESEAQYVAMNLLPALVQYPQFGRWVGRAVSGT